jgi:8-oxo-dGTP diphosphatase
MNEFLYLVNVDAAVVRDGDYLFIERAADEAHAGGSLAFPGGTVEQLPGAEATIESTAMREVAEEVGVDVGGVDYVHSRTFETDGGTPCINVLTLCEHSGGDAHPRATDEVAAVHWLSPDALRDRTGVPAFLLADVDRIEAHRTDPGSERR